MLFFAFWVFGSSFSHFWDGAPLFLNVTVLLATASLVLALFYFIISFFSSKKRKQKEQVGKSSVANQSKDFDPKDDIDPTRPIAILTMIENDGRKIAGPIELFEQLPHVTTEVMDTISRYGRKKLWD